MPANAWTVAQLADDTEREITGSHERWTAFLTTAARLYKYPYREQLMIFAQRPEATACAEYDLWNKTMRRYVRRGSKGIALVDTSGEIPRIRYVFDVADTGARHDSRSPLEYARLNNLFPNHQCGTFLSFGQLAKAFLPILVERPHIITFSRLEQPSKA